MNLVRYRYRLRPGATAMAALLREWDLCRWVWNQAVARLNESGEWVRDDTLTGWRRKHDWLREGSVVVQQQMLRNFRAKRAKGNGRRKFKSGKRSLPSLNYTKRGFAVRDGRLCLAGGLSIPVVWSRQLPSEPSSVRIYRDHIGHWYASFVVHRDEQALPVCERSIGIDWGVRAVATTTDPEYDLPHPEYGKRAARELARRQRAMARRKPRPGERASKGYLGAKRVVAKLSKKVGRQRQDTARKWATKVVADHGSLAVEDFKPRFLAKSRMARKSADGTIGATKATLIEYAQRAGRKVVLVPPAYTTMTCSGCGARAKSRLLLSERVFVCESCGMVQDRDRNAARVILDRAGLNPAGVEAVRHSSLLEIRVLAEPGIPAL
ncbi:MAG: putative transposase [Mycobacterium sp.]|jgi:putative transposase|nr:putative transposase [Mycobacterium sp.]MDT5317774.1 putative transposase [Mycobacterium sp.]